MLKSKIYSGCSIIWPPLFTACVNNMLGFVPEVEDLGGHNVHYITVELVYYSTCACLQIARTTYKNLFQCTQLARHLVTS